MLVSIPGYSTNFDNIISPNIYIGTFFLGGSNMINYFLQIAPMAQ